MNKLILTLVIITIGACTKTGGIGTDDENLKVVARDFSQVIDELEDNSYYKTSGHSIISRNGYRYSISIEDELYVIKVFDIKHKMSIFSTCSLYLWYASLNIQPKVKF